MKLRHFAALLLAACATAPLLAQEGPTRRLEISAGAQNLSNGYGRWRDLTLRGSMTLPQHVLQGELSAHKRDGTPGAFLSLGDTYTIDQDWYASAALGVGDGAFYLPNYRVDATLNRKFLPARNLVGTLGLGYYDAPDGHVDRSLSLGVTYYFESPWIVEGGVRFNSSNPGAVRTRQQFVALTWGRDKQDLVTARYGWGSEGYLAVTADQQLVNFDSREFNLSWRHWLNANTGVLVGATHYSNPLYRRNGVSVGLLHAF
jgi:YaiO family outer membrane protein